MNRQKRERKLLRRNMPGIRKLLAYFLCATMVLGQTYSVGAETVGSSSASTVVATTEEKVTTTTEVATTSEASSATTKTTTEIATTKVTTEATTTATTATTAATTEKNNKKKLPDISLRMGTMTQVYWNPNPNAKANEMDGATLVPGGDDGNTGAT